MPLDKVPFDGRGNMKTYLRARRRFETEEEYNEDLDWRDNTPFTATMELRGFGRGMSSARFHFIDHEGHTYEMFMKDMEHLFLHGIIEQGVVTGKWRICKRGQNYGLQFVE